MVSPNCKNIGVIFPLSPRPAELVQLLPWQRISGMVLPAIHAGDLLRVFRRLMSIVVLIKLFRYGINIVGRHEGAPVSINRLFTAESHHDGTGEIIKLALSGFGIVPPLYVINDF